MGSSTSNLSNTSQFAKADSGRRICGHPASGSGPGQSKRGLASTDGGCCPSQSVCKAISAQIVAGPDGSICLRISILHGSLVVLALQLPFDPLTKGEKLRSTELLGTEPFVLVPAEWAAYLYVKNMEQFVGHLFPRSGSVLSFPRAWSS